MKEECFFLSLLILFSYCLFLFVSLISSSWLPSFFFSYCLFVFLFVCLFVLFCFCTLSSPRDEAILSNFRVDASASLLQTGSTTTSTTSVHFLGAVFASQKCWVGLVSVPSLQGVVRCSLKSKGESEWWWLSREHRFSTSDNMDGRWYPQRTHNDDITTTTTATAAITATTSTTATTTRSYLLVLPVFLFIFFCTNFVAVVVVAAVVVVIAVAVFVADVVAAVAVVVVIVVVAVGCCCCCCCIV